MGTFAQAQTANASNCQNSGDRDTLYAGTISVPVNATTGIMLKSVSNSTTVSCKNNFSGNTTFTNHYSMRAAGTLVPGYTDVFQTNVTNLGVRYRVSHTNCGSIVLTSSNKILSCSMTVGPTASVFYLTTVAELVRVGTGPVAGALTSVPPVYLTVTASDWSGYSFSKPDLMSGSASGAINGLSCSVTTPNVVVDLGQARTTSFAAGVGATSAAKAFELALNCQAGVKVGITLTDAADPSNRTNTLKMASGATAQGIGVQVFHGAASTPVTYGPDSAVAGNTGQTMVGSTVTSGVFKVPMSARYIRTGAMTAGIVKSIATFTLSYQ